jgi:hypothetical protein
MAKLEKQIEKVTSEEEALRKEEADASFDHQALIEIGKKLEDVVSRRKKLESEWLELSEQISK